VSIRFENAKGDGAPINEQSEQKASADAFALFALAFDLWIFYIKMPISGQLPAV
jgi:hypothetical protein